MVFAVIDRFSICLALRSAMRPSSTSSESVQIGMGDLDSGFRLWTGFGDMNETLENVSVDLEA